MTLKKQIEELKLICQVDELLDPWREQLKRSGIYFDIRDAIVKKLVRTKTYAIIHGKASEDDVSYSARMASQ